MNLHQLIMSSESPQRVVRHVLFWAAVYMPMVGISCVPFIEYNWDMSTAVGKLFFWQFIYLRYLVVDILFSYLVVYHLLPRFVARKKYAAFIFSFFMLVAGTYLLSGLVVIRYTDHPDRFILALWDHTQIFINQGPLVRCALFLAAIAVKNYYVQVERRISLLRENASAELQLLKAQVHPHFLFNTLNNIYSFTLTRSPQAAQLLAKLSATMHYMINDCEAPLVLLSKEMVMIRDYIGLEKVRYGDRLRLEVRLEDENEGSLVTPLLMIPFIENAFKHGASRVLDNPWIIVTASVRKNRLHFFVSNSKPREISKGNGKSGIGLKNVKKRLELLYANQYTLQIVETDDTYSVEMVIPVSSIAAAQYQEHGVIEEGILSLT